VEHTLTETVFKEKHTTCQFIFLGPMSVSIALINQHMSQSVLLPHDNINAITLSANHHSE